MIIFARTKVATEELAVKLQARGFSAAAINGDLAQAQRERTIGQLKDGSIDILVATDVAARGLDVERITHVVNYDMPPDPESYTHRIGRTGRAGRSGEAILFVTPRERGLLKVIERATRQPIAALEIPSVQVVNNVRIARFKQKITEVLAEGGLDTFVSIVEDYEREHGTPAVQVAAALAKISRRGIPLLMEKPAVPEGFVPAARSPYEGRPPREGRPAREGKPAGAPSRFEDRARESRAGAPERPYRPRADKAAGSEFTSNAPDASWTPGGAGPAAKPASRRAPREGASSRAYRVEVGLAHGVKAGNLVGAIANETGLASRFIGRIDLRDTFSTVELPVDMPKHMLRHLQGVRVAGQPLRLKVATKEDLD
jgi:ATP-dependent RNA helicase DeaD